MLIYASFLFLAFKTFSKYAYKIYIYFLKKSEKTNKKERKGEKLNCPRTRATTAT